MGQKVIITKTIIENRLIVDDADVAGMSEEDIILAMQKDPEIFGVDDNPFIDPDVFVSISDLK